MEKNGLGKRINAVRKDRGLTADRLSEMCNINATYLRQIEGGVKIYEYTPGFVHGKSFVVDDKMAIVGTVNMDYRSYYLHYECGVWFYRSKVVMDVKRDYLETLSKSHQVTLEECRQVRLSIRIMRAILNLFSPMM